MTSERVQRRIDRLLDQAEEAVEKFDWARVLEAANAVLLADPQNPDALTFLRMAEGSGDPQNAATSTVSLPTSARSDDQPSSFASGRYTVSKFLGEGGKKKVYLAHDNTLDRDIAFALIKTEGLDETSRERVRREAQAMGRMGTHPCIMPIYDLGDESGQPFMVQPLMGGGDVEGLIEDAEGPLELDRAITIATQTAQGLSFAHGKGIVHRDLKPGNVWLDEDGSAKIGDFGLAVATDRSRLTVEKVIVGTVSYMPPEQATGGELTPRADFYSLGAMLYEMCTGRVPFMGDDDIGIISQHINTPPVAPSWHNNQIPKTLDSLILRLLAKDPAERPSDAAEVLAALQGVDLTAVEEREEESKGSLDSMAGGVFVGRHREMDQLKSIFEDVLSGRGRMVTLVGEPGIGKTRTAQELATYAGMRGAEVLWGRSYESGGAPPYWPWVQAIRSHVAVTEPDELRRQLGATAPVIAEIVSEVKSALPDVQPPPSIEDPESARFRLFDSIGTFFKNVSGTQPLVLMLEDLHWSDKPSLMLLEFVARELANSRILIVGNYRDMELNRRHPLSVTLGDLTRERLFERVVLRGLQKHDVQRFIEIAAGIAPPAVLVDTVHSQTEGNPLFVTETVRLLIQEGDITSGHSSKGGTTSWEIRVPEGVREVIGRRLDRLSERCNEVLTIAAVIGRQFRFDVLKMLAEDTTDNQLLDVLDEALSARIIEELPEEVGFYQFTHAQMQETLTSELSANRTVRMHARIAVGLEEYWGDAADNHAAELVEHYIEAEIILGGQRLFELSQMAGDAALEQFANEEAAVHLRRAVETAPDKRSPKFAEVLTSLGRSLAHDPERGHVLEAFDCWQQAFQLFKDAGETEKAASLATLPLPIAPFPRSYALFTEKALALIKPGSLIEGYIRARNAIAYYSGAGSIAIAQSQLEKAMHLADSHGDDTLKARVQAYRTQLQVLTGQTEQTLNTIDGVVQSAISTNDLPGAWSLLTFAWRAACREGKPDYAIELVERLVDAHPGNLPKNVVNTRSTCLASVAALRGNWSDATNYYEIATQIDRESQEFPEVWHPGVLNQTLSGAEVDGILSNGYNYLKDGNWTNPRRHMTVAATEYGLLTGDFVHIPRYLELARDVRNAWKSTGEGNPEYVERSLELAIGYAEAVGSGNSEYYENLKMHASAGEYRGIDPWLMKSENRLFANIAWRSGELDLAEDHFLAGSVFLRNASYRPELTWNCADYSELLLDRNASGDREQAIELQDEAIAIATELGMKPLLHRVLAKREILKA